MGEAVTRRPTDTPLGGSCYIHIQDLVNCDNYANLRKIRFLRLNFIVIFAKPHAKFTIFTRITILSLFSQSHMRNLRFLRKLRFLPYYRYFHKATCEIYDFYENYDFYHFIDRFDCLGTLAEGINVIPPCSWNLG